MDGGAAVADGSVRACAQAERATQLDTLTIHAKRANATAPLGFSLYGERPSIRRLAVSDYRDDSEDNPTDKNVNDTPFSEALRAAGVVEPCCVVGWRILQVDGADVTSSSDVIALLKGKHAFSMTLAPPA
ncbi:hypothetical protein TraAM80_04903 [Trypanosoma rangeli]|nr:uncharacterized protein TraAM80_04903 [Trypanosoma rangeli]RNF04778.1 hypothetical protein TraAM80_04903 [Trypanosoma rangeli]|eukprot:RNF04778.1 hypothetical protein TraAM80_04903 [Trypanosoma rangeli]